MDETERAIAEWYRDGSSVWPGVKLPIDVFASFVREHVDKPDGVVVESLHGADLYLACGCWLGDEQAARLFRSTFFPEIARALGALCRRSQSLEDLQQIVYERLFLPSPAGGPKIETYSGRGALRHWVRVTAVRIGYNHLRDIDRAERRLARDMPAQAFSDTEASYLRTWYGGAFDKAFHDAYRALEPKDRNLLRFRYVEGVPVQQLAVMNGVHRMTITRWLAEVRRTLSESVKVRMAQEIGAALSEVSTIIRLLRPSLTNALRSSVGSAAADRG